MISVISAIGELTMGVIDDVALLGTVGSNSRSLGAVVLSIEGLVPPGTAWWSISAISTIWALGALAVSDIDDVGSLGTAKSDSGRQLSVLIEIDEWEVVCVVWALTQASGAAQFISGVALSLETMLGVI